MKKLTSYLWLIALGSLITTTGWCRILDNEIMTPQGNIEIWADIHSRDEIYNGDPITYDVMLNKKLLFQQKDMNSIRFKWVKPINPPSALVLLALEIDDRYCGAFYRLIDAQKSAPLYVSEQFGNCSSVTIHEEGNKVIFYFPESYESPETAYSYTRETKLKKISVTAAMRKYPIPGIPPEVQNQ